MRMNLRRLSITAALGALLSLPACGPLIYDEDERSMVDATSYTAWTYIDLATGQATVVQEYGDEPAGTPPDKWHFALHRYNCKTNGAEVLETGFTKIDDIITRGVLPEGEYAADIWTDDVIMYDVSGMMEGEVKYAESWYNAELSKWIDVDLGTMPPVYTPSDRVYVLKFADGTAAALKFTDFVGPKDVKWHIAFDYIYPLDL